MKAIGIGLAAIAATAGGFLVGLALSDQEPEPTHVGSHLVTVTGPRSVVHTPTLSAAAKLPPLVVSTEEATSSVSSSTEPFTSSQSGAGEESKEPFKGEEKKEEPVRTVTNLPPPTQVPTEE
jgi:hypothetical protein